MRSNLRLRVKDDTILCNSLLERTKSKGKEIDYKSPTDYINFRNCLQWMLNGCLRSRCKIKVNR